MSVRLSEIAVIKAMLDSLIATEEKSLEDVRQHGDSANPGRAGRDRLSRKPRPGATGHRRIAQVAPCSLMRQGGPLIPATMVPFHA